ncbi:MAG: hypothetical protein FWB88_00145 [Defluviitaleaceae bacterium]|nr:hypothetical protein [Defluviitaleaceae bacterium]MCL2239124.1 hypothetical protein [Defluviitaleaceae bacterium]
MKSFVRWLIIPVLIGLFNISLLAFPREVLSAAREGLLLWFHTVLPSLLPFVVGMNILMGLGFLRFIGELLSPVAMKVFGVGGAGGVAFVTGIASGYPMGAKTIGDMYRAGDIKAGDAQKLMGFCNNAGPLFIVGAVGMGMFGCARAGYTLLIGHILGAVILGLLQRGKGNAPRQPIAASRQRQWRNPQKFSKVLGESVRNAMEAMLLVGGLIIFFNVVVRILQIITGLEGALGGGVLGGLFEISGGVRAVSGEGVSTLSLALAAGIIGFGGLSVHAQALHFTAGTGVRPAPYIIGKLLHGILAAGLTALIWIKIQGG